jgi:hypothetical protein
VCLNNNVAVLVGVVGKDIIEGCGGVFLVVLEFGVFLIHEHDKIVKDDNSLGYKLCEGSELVSAKKVLEIRSLKEAGPKEYRDLADYYIALMYRFDFRTDALSSEESYVIGQELLTMGLIMENPFAAEYLESFSVFHQ